MSTNDTVSGSNAVRVATAVLCTLFVGASVTLFVISLANDGFYIDRPSNPRAWAPCSGLLLIGWIAVFNGVLAWLANPAIFVSWLTIWFRPLRPIALVCASVALCLSLSFMLHREILTDEGGGRSRITGYGPGYWLWNASIGTMVLGTVIVSLVNVSPTPKPRALADGWKKR